MVALLPFVMSMMLGRTMDISQYEPYRDFLVDINSTQEVLNKLEAKYRVIQDAEDFYNLLQVPIDMVLRSKLGDLRLKAGDLDLSDLLASRRWHEPQCLIALSVRYLTVRDTIQGSLPTDPSWKTPLRLANTTHYAKRLQRGEQVYVLFRLTSPYPGDIPIIRRTLHSVLMVSGAIDDKLPDKWEKVTKALQEADLRATYEVEKQLFTTIPLNGDLFSPQGLVDLVKRLPSEVQARNETSPVHLMEMRPLSELDDSFPRPYLNMSKVQHLFHLDRQFDDVRMTQQDLQAWVALVDDESLLDKEVSDLQSHLETLIKKYISLLDHVSLYVPFNMSAIADVRALYNTLLPYPGATYQLVFLRIKEARTTDCSDKFEPSIRGFLRASSENRLWEGPVDGELQDCQDRCAAHPRCRSVIYGTKLSLLDPNTGLWRQTENRCWLTTLSSRTTEFHPEPQVLGETAVYDRICY